MTVRMSTSGSINVLPQMKITKSGTAKKLLDEHGGLGYMWMNQKVFIANNKKNGGLIGGRPYKNHRNGRGITITKCSCCEKELDDVSTRGMTRTKCDICKKDTDNLVNTIRYWSKKVGVKIETG